MAFYSAVLAGGLLLGSATGVLFQGFGGIWDLAGAIAFGGFVVVFTLFDLLLFQRWAKTEVLADITSPDS